jgi:hypothetical protein
MNPSAMQNPTEPVRRVIRLTIDLTESAAEDPATLDRSQGSRAVEAEPDCGLVLAADPDWEPMR